MKCPANITTVVAGAANPLLITICFIFYTLDETIPAPRQDSLKLDFNMRGMQDVTSVGVLANQRSDSAPAFLVRDLFKTGIAETRNLFL